MFASAQWHSESVERETPPHVAAKILLGVVRVAGQRGDMGGALRPALTGVHDAPASGLDLKTPLEVPTWSRWSLERRPA